MSKAKKTEGEVSVFTRLQKKYGVEAISVLGNNKVEDVEAISTGSVGVDLATGIGGLPRGRIVEIYGPESSGKTTLCTHLVANAQKMGLKCAYIDAEHAFDLKYAQALGVDVNELVFCQPDFGEQGIDIAEELAESGEYGVIVIDSIAALTPKAELDGELVQEDGTVKQHMGLQARMMSQACRHLATKASKGNTLIVLINQLRQKIGVVYGNPETTPGGNAVKYYASIRLDIRRIGKVEAGGVVSGARTRVKVVKNKLARPFQEAELDIRYGEGFDSASELLDLAVEKEKMTMSGGRYKLNDQQVAYGREPARLWAIENRDMLKSLVGLT